MEGSHLFNKSNSDVMGVVIEYQLMIYMMQGGNAFFCHLEHIAVLFSNLTYVQRSDLRHLRNIKTIALCSNNIQRIPEDTFLDLVKLEYLALSSNQIKSLPSFIFRPLVNLKGLYLQENKLEVISHLLLKHNSMLEDVKLNDNDIKVISTNITEPLRQLKHFHLLHNTCINRNYNDFTPKLLDQFKREISENCSSDCEHKMNEVAVCNEKVYELEKALQNLERENDKLRNYLKSSSIF